LIEVIQDPIKREENIRMLGRSFDEVTQDLADKGISTEAEARSYVDSFIAQQVNGSSNINVDSPSAGLTTVTTTARTVDEAAESDKSDKKVKASLRDEIQELTEQIASLRSELEQMR
jgi:polyhydroxyalkanoate synthesis regulator phasin